MPYQVQTHSAVEAKSGRLHETSQFCSAVSETSYSTNLFQNEISQQSQELGLEPELSPSKAMTAHAQSQ